MSPDWTRPTEMLVLPTSCARCDQPLGGNRMACPSCVIAARVAIAEAGGRTVLPADIERIRRRDAALG